MLTRMCALPHSWHKTFLRTSNIIMNHEWLESALVAENAPRNEAGAQWIAAGSLLERQANRTPNCTEIMVRC